MVGPGYWPLMSMHSFDPWPSGLQVVFVMSKLYFDVSKRQRQCLSGGLQRFTVTVFPAGGNLASKSVAILKPLLQHALVKGPLVHAASGAREVVVVACRWTKAAPRSNIRLGIVAVKAEWHNAKQTILACRKINMTPEQGYKRSNKTSPRARAPQTYSSKLERLGNWPTWTV